MSSLYQPDDESSSSRQQGFDQQGLGQPSDGQPSFGYLDPSTSAQSPDSSGRQPAGQPADDQQPYSQQADDHQPPGRPAHDQQPYAHQGPSQTNYRPPDSSYQGYNTASSTGSRGGSKLPLIIGGVALAFVLVLVVAVAGTLHSLRKEDSDGGGGNGPTKVRYASDAVKGYLNALAAGDSQKALSYLATQPSDTSLMTDAVLKTSLKKAPITDINVPQVTDQLVFEVAASYKIGGKPVNAKFLINDDNNSYQLDEGYAELDLGYINGLPLTINGVSVAADRIYLFPGSYTLATPAKYVSLGAESNFLIQEPSYAPLLEVRPELSSEGQRLVSAKVTAAIHKCIASTKLNAGCGLDVPAKTEDGYTVKDGTLHRTLGSDAKHELASLEFALSDENPTIAQTSGLYGPVETTATLVKGKEHKTDEIYSDGTELGQPSVDLTDKNLTVTWSK